MSEPRFTPGGWYVLREGYADMYLEPGIAYWSRFDMSGRTDDEKKEAWERLKANVALMRKAPDMFDTLQKCLKYLRGYPGARNAELETEIEMLLEDALDTNDMK